jgi:pimeloyl-ACP methyl ester carboxylesterase
MDQNTIQKIKIPAINKEVVFINGAKEKVLLVHGWSGRGTQLFKIADELLKQGYSQLVLMHLLMANHLVKQQSWSILSLLLEIEKQFGPFDAAIGHSLGGMSVLNHDKKKGLKVNHAVVIGSGDIVRIIDDFIAKLELKPTIGSLLSLHFEENTGKK